MTVRPRPMRLALVVQLGLLAAVTALAYAGALRPGLVPLHHADKLGHLLLVGPLALWITLGWRDPRLRVLRARLPVAVVLPLLVSGLDELAQIFSPHRSAELGDLAADAVGLVVFWWIGRAWLGRRATHHASD